MTPWSAIHRRWASAAPLAALLPAARLFSELAVDVGAEPYVVVKHEHTTPLARTSSRTRVELVQLTLALHHDNFDQALRTAAEAARWFDGWSGPADECRIVDSRATVGGCTALEVGRWRCDIRCELTCEQTSGELTHG